MMLGLLSILGSHLFRSLCNRICVQLMLELKVIDDAKPYFIFILVMCSFSYKVVMHCHCFCPNCCPEKMSKIDIDMCTVSLSFTPPRSAKWCPQGGRTPPCGLTASSHGCPPPSSKHHLSSFSPSFPVLPPQLLGLYIYWVGHRKNGPEKVKNNR